MDDCYRKVDNLDFHYTKSNMKDSKCTHIVKQKFENDIVESKYTLD